MDDLQLVEKISNSNNEAFNTLYNKYYKRLVGYMRSYTNDLQQSEDIVQQVFMNLWLNRKRLNIKTSVVGYLKSTSYTSYIDSYRKTRRKLNALDEMKYQALKDCLTEDQGYLNLKIRKLKQIIETLPPACKQVLELNKMEGLKYDEIALKLNISKKTVESHMRVAFKKIRKGFEGHGFFSLVFQKK